MSLKKGLIAGLCAVLVAALCGACKAGGGGAGAAAASDAGHPRVDRSVPELRAAMNKPLPPSSLVGLDGGKLDEQALRRGKVVLVFVNPTCAPCNKEAEFLSTVVNKRQDVSFYGVAAFGEKEASLKDAAARFPFKTFYDDGSMLTQSLGITRMPIKLYLDDGVVKESWGGASKNQEIQDDFVRWMENLQ
jgi:thiol-disulfide isomerase/thioredoxin